MATLYISEFPEAHFGNDTQRLTTAIRDYPALAEQTVAIGGTSAASAAFNAATSTIRVHTDAICSVLVGATPVATAANMRLAAGDVVWMRVAAGAKIAVITNA